MGRGYCHKLNKHLKKVVFCARGVLTLDYMDSLGFGSYVHSSYMVNAHFWEDENAINLSKYSFDSMVYTLTINF